ncbi:MAG: DUF3418 domain-containing protein, partial [Desulfobacterales bacterium]|nr:DUF3418 domain-containing protein [Desulfobacterales bacterium]
IETSRDPAILKQQKTGGQPDTQLTGLRSQWEKTGITPESLPDLPDTLKAPVSTPEPWVVFPALTLEGGQVALRLFDNAPKALAAHRQAVRQLYANYFTKDIRFLKRKLLLPEYLTPAARHFGGNRALEKQIEETLLDSLFAKNIRSVQEFQEHATEISPRIMNSGDEFIHAVKAVIEAYSETCTVIDSLRKNSFSNGPASSLTENLMAELRKLIPENFITLYEIRRLPHLVRYAKALAIRARRALDAPEKDRQKAALIDVHGARLKELLETFTPTTSADKRRAVEKYFWLIEEYKVSQYAQELKTVEKVSAKRLDRLYADILRIA